MYVSLRYDEVCEVCIWEVAGTQTAGIGAGGWMGGAPFVCVYAVLEGGEGSGGQLFFEFQAIVAWHRSAIPTLTKTWLERQCFRRLGCALGICKWKR